MERLRVGVIGLGFIGSVHVEAIRRLGYAEVYAVCDVDRERAAQLSIERCYENYTDIINDPSIDIIHNCTPNHLHYEINRMAIEKGKHVFSEKPLAMNAAESGALLKLLETHPVYNAVNHNYRMYHNVQKMIARVRNGKIGVPHLVHGSYLQDWLLYDTDYNWRLEPQYGGATRAVADIGSHWCDLAQMIVGSRIAEVFADLKTVIPVRKQIVKTPDGETVREIPMQTEDFASVMLRFENGVSGVFYVSQVSAGRKNYLDIEVNGSKGSLHWNQENCDRLWHGRRDGENTYAIREAATNEVGLKLDSLPAGHAEGWSEGLRNNIALFYTDIINGTHEGGYATMRDGHEMMLVLEAILKSSQTEQWQKVARDEVL